MEEIENWEKVKERIKNRAEKSLSLSVCAAVSCIIGSWDSFNIMHERLEKYGENMDTCYDVFTNTQESKMKGYQNGAYYFNKYDLQSRLDMIDGFIEQIKREQ